MSQSQLIATNRQPSYNEVTDEVVACRAYEKWQQRGCPLGQSEEDWFAARAELEEELRAQPPVTPTTARQLPAKKTA